MYNIIFLVFPYSSHISYLTYPFRPNQDEIGLKEWALSLRSAHKLSQELLGSMARKAGKIYGTERDTVLAGVRPMAGTGSTTPLSTGSSPAGTNGSN